MPPKTPDNRAGFRRGGKPPPSGDNKTQIIIAVIGAMATITAAIIGAISLTQPSGPSSSAGQSASATAPTLATAAPSATAPPGPAAAGSGSLPSGYRLPPGTIPETEEEAGGAETFKDYATLAQGDRIPRGVTVAVYCRVPDSDTIQSVGKAGWYKILDLDHKIGYVGANTFYNDPGNGFGTSPYTGPYDPRVPIC